VSSSSRAPLIVFSAAFLLVGAIFVYIGGGTVLEEQRYQQQGVRTEAVATAKTLRRATSDSETSYDISYRFNLSDGRPYEQTESTSVHLWERVERDSPLVVEYVSGQPESARMVGDRSDQKGTAIGALGVGGVLVLIGVVVLISGFRRSSRDLPSVPPDAAVPEAIESAGQPSTVVLPREQSFRPLARRSFGFWFGGILLLIGLPFFAIGIYRFYDDWRFAQEARTTEGIVLTKEIRLSGNSRSRTKHYEATYRFTVQGETLEGRDELSHEEWQRLVEREPVEMLYRPQKISSNHLASHSAWLLKTIFVLLGSICTAIGGTVFVRAVRNTRLEWHLRQHGVSTRGTVTELRERNVKVNNVQLWRLHYEYRDFQGHRHVRTFDMPQDEAQGWTVGDVGGVLYDSARPTEAVWLDREETR
jgi:hypothetical protein